MRFLEDLDQEVWFGKKETEVFDKKRSVREYVKLAVKLKDSLKDVKQDLCDNGLTDCVLVNTDESYINEKYIKYCYNELIVELTIFIKESIDNNQFSYLINDYNDYIKRLINRSFYKKLLDNEKHLNNFRNEIRFKNKLIRVVKNLLKENSELFQNEYNLNLFLIELKKFLCLFTVQLHFDDMDSQLKVIKFLKNEIPIKQFIEKINHHKKSFESWKMTDEYISQSESNPKFDKFMNEIESKRDCLLEASEKFNDNYDIVIKPNNFMVNYLIKLCEKTLNYYEENENSLVIEKICFVLSCHKPFLMDYIRENTNISEIRIISNEIIYIDTDLVLPSINLLLYARQVIVISPVDVTLDLSGKPGIDAQQTSAMDGSDPAQDGEDGKDGGSGKSGGNLTVVANSVRLDSKWIIISNGGKGGDGQPGGNGVKGAKGADGREYGLSEVKALFPDPCCFSDLIPFRSHSIAKESWNRLFPGKAIIEENSFLTNLIFCEAQNEEGNMLELTYLNQMEVLVLMKGAKGSIGQLGGKGGLGGRGGSGGFKGIIEFRHTNEKIDPIICGPQTYEITNNNGMKGRNGNPGQSQPRGKTGKNGRDSGYCDQITWNSTVEFDLQHLEVIRYPTTALRCIINTMPLVNSLFDDAVYCWYNKEMVRIVRDDDINRNIRNYSEDIQYKPDRREKVSNSVKSKAITNDVINKYELNEIETPVENQSSSEALHIMSKFESLKEEKLEEVLITTSKPFVVNKKLKNRRKTGISVKANEDVLRGFRFINGISDQKLMQFVQKSIEDFNFNDCSEIISKYRLKPTDNESEKLWKSIVIEKNRFFLLRSVAKSIENGLNNYLTENNEKKQLMIPTPVTEGYDSALHCFFGEENIFGYYECNDTDNKRKKFGDSLLDRLKTSAKEEDLLNNFSQSLKALFELNSHYLSNFSKLKYEFEEYSKLESKDNYDWHLLAKDKSIQKEYTELIKLYKYRHSLSDLQLMAIINNCKLCIYKFIYFEDIEQPIRELISSNSCIEPEKEIDISYEEKEITDSDHKKLIFYRLDCEQCFDMSLTFNRLGQIIDNCNKVNDFVEIEYFLKTGDLKQNTVNESVHDSDEEYFDAIEESVDELKLRDDSRVNEIKNYFPEYERNKIILSQLKPENTNSDILEIIWRRFRAEGLGISAHEMKILISKLNENCKESNDKTQIGQNFNKYRWILSAYPQNKWITELVLCELQENYSKELIIKWRKCLYQIKTQEVIQLLIFKLEDELLEDKEMDKFFELLSNYNDINEDQNELFEELSLSDWMIKLREIRLEKLLDGIQIKWKVNNNNEKETILYYLFTLNNEYENTLIKLLQELSKVGSIPSEDVKKEFISLSNGSSILVEPNPQNINSGYSKTYSDVFKEFCETFEGERDVNALIEIIKKDDKTSIEKNSIEFIKIYVMASNKLAKDFSQTLELGPNVESEKMKAWIKGWIEWFKKQEGRDKYIPNALEIINQVIKHKRGYSLRDTQKVTVMSTLINKRHLLSQVATGEGKSLIVVSLAIIECLFGHKVDVVTSSPVLAKRDAEENVDIFEMFGITVGHNTSEKIEGRQQQYREKDVIFGDCSCFQRDFLLDKFYNKNIRLERSFDCVIVDEVDSMLLDKGNCVLYLSHQPPGLDSLETIFINIWQYIILSPDCYETSKIITICNLSQNYITV